MNDVKQFRGRTGLGITDFTVRGWGSVVRRRECEEEIKTLGMDEEMAFKITC